MDSYLEAYAVFCYNTRENTGRVGKLPLLEEFA